MEKTLKETLEEAGGVASIAALFGISTVSVYEWIDRGVVPAERCPEIEEFANHRVLCEQLNPKVKWEVLRRPLPVNHGRRVTDRKP